MAIKNRIKSLKHLSVDAIEANQKNHRRHPLAQREGLRGMLDDVGLASACIVREKSKGKYQLIDGHLRFDLVKQRFLKGEKVPCIVLDVSEAEADKLLATMDGLGAMAKIDGDSFADLLDGIESNNSEVSQLLESLSPYKPPEEEEEDDPTLEEEIDEAEGTKLYQAGDSPFTMTNNCIFLPTSNRWDFPDLDQMAIPEIPERLDCWAGDSACHPDDAEAWLYIASTGNRGLPWERSIAAFFCDDYRWERMWDDPAKYVGNLLARGVTMALEPNFSLFPNTPRACMMWQTYRTRFMGRYMQEAGLEVIPTIQWCDEETLDWICDGIPKGANSIAIQLQTCEGGFRVESTGKTHSKAEINVKCLQAILDHLKPKSILAYGHPKNRDRQLKQIRYSGKVVAVDSHSYRRKQEKKVW